MKKLLLIIFLIFSLFLAHAADIFAVDTIPLLVKPIKILLVPGHDDTVWGAQYGNMKEADMTLTLATQIYNILKKDKRFEVYITRDSNGYTKKFADYYKDHLADIVAFERKGKKIMQENIASGSFIQKPNAPHLTVSDDIALRLFGFNKWADENNINAVIHIHFNDYPRPSKWTIGEYTGFAIYKPDNQFVNWKESGQLATNIFTELKKKYGTSTYKPELGGLISDQKLIAMGTNNTLNQSVRSVLIEYGYIYEKKFRTSSARLTAYTNMANATATGVQNYFFGK